MPQTKWNDSAFFHMDILLLAGLVLLTCLGMVILYSAGDEDLGLMARQTVRLALGFGIMIVLAQIPPRVWLNWVPWMYMAGIALLLAVLVAGTVGMGAQRWLDLKVFRFQPSELMKLVVPMTVAWYFSEKPLPPSYPRLLVALFIVMLPVLLVAKQPDLGTALLIAASGIITLFLAGMDWRLIGGVTIMVIGVVLVAKYTTLLEHVLHKYQIDRIKVFFNPESEPLGAGYHIIQSKIAIGSGGVYGKGLLNGTQSHLEFLPERSTDFIFAVYSEEFGFFGVLLLLGLYLFVILRGLFLSTQVQGTFGRLLAGSITLTFFVYIFVNMGMVSGILPVVGLPLPLLSYGGTSAVSVLAGFGLIMSAYTHRRLLSDEKNE